MAFTKTLKEKKRALDAIHAAGGWYALLVKDSPTVININSVNTSTDTITATGHDFVNGVRVTVANSGGSLPGGLAAASTEYRIVSVSGNTFKICAEADYNATNKTGTAIDITSIGSGTTIITEAELSAKDDLDVWVRKEAEYYGSARQSLAIPVSTINYTNEQIASGPANVTFTPTGASITFRYFAVISGGNVSRGNNTGILAGFEDYVFSQTIDSSGKIFQYGVVI